MIEARRRVDAGRAVKHFAAVHLRLYIQNYFLKIL